MEQINRRHMRSVHLLPLMQDFCMHQMHGLEVLNTILSDMVMGQKILGNNRDTTFFQRVKSWIFSSIYLIISFHDRVWGVWSPACKQHGWHSQLRATEPLLPGTDTDSLILPVNWGFSKNNGILLVLWEARYRSSRFQNGASILSSRPCARICRCIEGHGEFHY